MIKRRRSKLARSVAQHQRVLECPGCGRKVRCRARGAVAQVPRHLAAPENPATGASEVWCSVKRLPLELTP